MEGYRYDIGYGKQRVPVYRVFARPLRGITPIPESPFVGRNNNLLSFEVDVDVLGDDFLPAYTHGDNSMVVATDSMKNFILHQAVAYEGATLEGFLFFLGQSFAATYSQLRHLRLTARELPFAPVLVPDGSGAFNPSEILYGHHPGDHAIALLELAGPGEQLEVVGHRCGRVNLQLMKLTGSSFIAFVRDGYTTLPERRDRPLYVYLDVFWRYALVDDVLAPTHVRYVPAEQVRDLVSTIFHRFVSESIQHLVHEMGTRLLERFPQLAEVSFVAQNRTRDPVVESKSDPSVRVYSDPFPAYGEIRLTMSRGGMSNGGRR
jgi:urate oxidase